MKYFLLLSILLLLGCSKKQQKKTSLKEAKNISAVDSKQPLRKNHFWTFSSKPSLKIGVKSGQKAYMFHRLSDAIRLADGRLVVSNAGTYELRIYDAEGNYLHSFGRSGKGPGEFGTYSSMHILRMSEDSMAVIDVSNERINIFNVKGGFGHAVIVPRIKNAGNPNIVGMFKNGRWLVWSTRGSAALTGNPGDLIKKEYVLHYLNKDGSYGASLFSFPARPRYVHQFGGTRHYPYIPLSPSAQYITDKHNNVLYAPGQDPEIFRVNQKGMKTAVFRWHIPRIKVSDIWNQYRKSYLPPKSRPDQRKLYRNYLQQDLPIPDLVPAIGNIYVDRIGYIWVERFPLPGKTTKWDVLNTKGKWLGTLQIPQGVSMFEIGKDYLLGKRRTKDGIEQLVLYNLNRH